MTAAGFRVETDVRSEKVGRKIRDAEVEKVPVMLVVGRKEAEDGTVSVRRHGQGDVGSKTTADLAAHAAAEVDAATGAPERSARRLPRQRPDVRRVRARIVQTPSSVPPSIRYTATLHAGRRRRRPARRPP